MALQFNPPEWLIQDYMTRRRPQDELADQLDRMSQQAVAERQRNQALGLKRQELGLKQAELGYDPNNPAAYWERVNADRQQKSALQESQIRENNAKADYYGRMPSSSVTAPEQPTDYYDPVTGQKRFTVPPGGKLVPPTIATTQMKAQTETDTQDKAKANVSSMLEELKGYYETLRNRGGIVDSSQGLGQNVAAKIASSGPGQFVGRAVGTQNQSVRNSILSIQPQLINLIRKAEKMGAKGLDSNVELQFYLKAATDPNSMDYQSNIRAIDRLEQAYGKNAPSKSGSAVPSGSADPLGIR